MVLLCTKLPALPETVSFRAGLKANVESVVKVSVELCPLVTVVGEKEAVIPVGRPAMLSVMEATPPSADEVETPNGRELPPIIVAEEGLTWTEKSEARTFNMMPV